ncbi:MAG: cellulase family glycosylhydrolase [Planctomycetota bacterium]
MRRVTLLQAAVAAAVFYGNAVAFEHFVARQGDKLLDGETPVRFVSWNIPNLHNVEDAFGVGPTPWHWPDEFEIGDALEAVRQMGGTVVRTYVLSVRREGSDAGGHVHLLAPGEFNEEAFRTLDLVMKVAGEKGVRVIVPFVDNWHWWGGAKEYAAFRGKPPEAFWTDPEVMADFKQTVRYLINRRNTLTRERYRDDKALFAWETGNEIDAPQEWTREIAAEIKRLDPNHLVIDGRSLGGLPVESLDDPNIDIVTTHHYPNQGNNNPASIREAAALARGKRPYFVGEFGFLPTDKTAEMLDAVIDEGAAGALLWSLRFRRSEGGFYWHSEGASGDAYKSYHWPGFPSGDRYDERGLLSVVRDRAFRIRGIEPPEFQPPAAPVLLPIAGPEAISWKGSAGASGYKIERTEDPEGPPWEVVAENVSDAATQYQPLWADESVKAGKTYHYRVVAEGAGGVSTPSNAVGPVRVEHRVLVDDCDRLDKPASHEGGVEAVYADARKAQEDIHRYRMQPGASVTYEPGGPIESVAFVAYAAGGMGNPVVAASTGDGRFSPMELQLPASDTAPNDYGYHRQITTPRLKLPAGTTTLKIEAPAGGEGNFLELSRVALRYGAPNQPKWGAQLSPSVLLFHKRRHTSGVDSVRRAAELGFRRVCVVPTMLAEIDEENHVIRYAYADGRETKPLDQAGVERFQAAVRETFAEAVAHGMQISIVAHLNAAGPHYEWRNKFRFDPLAFYDGHSYYESVLKPIAAALQETVEPGSHVEFAVCGEMGRSVFAYPHEYIQILHGLRAENPLLDLKVGVSLNFNDIADGQKLSRTQRLRAAALLPASDFLGMSNYRWFEPPPRAGQFAGAVAVLRKQLSDLGIPLPAALPLHFSEVGIGGGNSDGDLAASPAEAARTPWQGSDNPDENPWTDPAMRAFRVTYHRALLEFLSNQDGLNPVTDAFLWSEGSWDPLDTTDRGFVDEEIQQMIQEHNRSVRPHPGY